MAGCRDSMMTSRVWHSSTNSFGRCRERGWRYGQLIGASQQSTQHAGNIVRNIGLFNVHMPINWGFATGLCGVPSRRADSRATTKQLLLDYIMGAKGLLLATCNILVCGATIQRQVQTRQKHSQTCTFRTYSLPNTCSGRDDS